MLTCPLRLAMELILNTKEIEKFANRNGKILDCIGCGCKFFAAQHRLKQGVTITCSYECAAVYRKSQTPLNTSCAQCGNKFHMKPSHSLKVKEPSCSKECCKELQRKRMSGKRNHQYGLKGEHNSSWDGGRRLTTYGYIKDTGVLEHRKVWLDSGKSIPDGYVVHHKNHIKTDNRLVNLEVMSLSDHSGFHAREMVDRRDTEGGRFLKDRSLVQDKQYVIDNYTDLLPETLRVLELDMDDIGFKLPRPLINKLYNVSGIHLQHLIAHVKYLVSVRDEVALKGAMMILTYKLYTEGEI